MPAVYPIEMFAPLLASSYPHMAKRDAALWQRWLKDNLQKFYAVSYDVALGGEDAQFGTDDEAFVKGWQYTTALKVDVIGWTPTNAWIIEVRPEATVSTYGAALGYTLVAQREEITKLPLVPAILCESIQIDVAWLCERAGIRVLRVPRL